jgi:predicted porin
LKSGTYGKLTVGLEGTATYHLLDDADGTNTRNYSDAQAAAVAQGAFFLRSGGNGVGGAVGSSTALRWSDILRGVDNGTPGQNGRRNIVRYDSPEIAGFVVTASWGEDDMGGVALTYKNTFGDFNLLGKVGYERSSDETTSPCSALPAQDCEWWGAAGTIMHVPTGLYVYGGFGQNHDNAEATNPLADANDKMWFIQAGIEREFIPLGKTTIFGEYRHDDAGSNLGKSFAVGNGPSAFVQSSDLNFWAGGLVQNIKAAAMDLYVIYRHADGTTTNAAEDSLRLDDFDMVITGARIQF